ncbi:hypothetical protein JCM10450v2_008074 [Rhodotorula kratochvilovae]
MRLLAAEAASPLPPFEPRRIQRLAAQITPEAGAAALRSMYMPPAPPSPDLWYDDQGRLRSSRPPAPVSVDADEAASEEALFVESLRAGEASQRRRAFAADTEHSLESLFAPPGAPDVSADWEAYLDELFHGGDARDEVVSDTGWVHLGAATAPAEPEISPEERRAAREAWTRGPGSFPFEASPGVEAEEELDDGGWGPEVQQQRREMAREVNRMLQEREDRRNDGGSIWRNDPHSIPRTAALPRGGRLLAPSTSTFSPSNPPAPAPAPPGARPIRRLPRRGDGLPPLDPATLTLRGQAAYDAFLASAVEARAPRVARRVAVVPDSEEESDSAASSEGAEVRVRESPRRRTREETNAMMGAALRSKKAVALLYCGSAGSRAEAGEALPKGFAWEGEGEGARGCGALVCARALLDGVPAKVFFDAEEKREEPAASSDLPPVAGRAGDWGEEGEDGGERVGKRGWRGCKGCLTRDVGCKRCGNHLGYRLLRPCVTCSISRPAYTSYANVVTSAHAQPLVLSAGGVTGGGVVDGLLFHYRLAGVTPLPRLVGRTPREELAAEERARARSGEGAEDEGDEEGEDARERAGRANAPAIRRLREKPPREGERMRWKAIPSAQRDFQDGLVGEPGDWIDPEGETWWLENGIPKHARKRTAGGAWGDGGSRAGFSTDRLSTASTTVPSTTSSPNGGASLSRAHAIRLRVPLSGAASSALAEGGGGDGAQYDRFRADAGSFARRVRRRLADPSAAEGDAVGRLERAGYGSGFEAEEEERGGGESRERRGRRAEAVGR